MQRHAQPKFGKVFFTEGNTNYVCSGTATNSANGDVVTTAGHCVNEGPGVFVTNFAFVPAYNNGSRPTAPGPRKRCSPPPVGDGGDYDYDAGFAVMNENAAGQDLTHGDRRPRRSRSTRPRARP